LTIITAFDVIWKFFFLPPRADHDVNLRIIGPPISGMIEHPSVADIPKYTVRSAYPRVSGCEGWNWLVEGYQKSFKQPCQGAADAFMKVPRPSRRCDVSK